MRTLEKALELPPTDPLSQYLEQHANAIAAEVAEIGDQGIRSQAIFA